MPGSGSVFKVESTGFLKNLDCGQKKVSLFTLVLLVWSDWKDGEITKNHEKWERTNLETYRGRSEAHFWTRQV